MTAPVSGDITALISHIERQITELAASSKRRVYSTRGAAEYCGMNYGTFLNRIASGTGPIQHKEGSSNAFFEADLDAWNEARLHPVVASRISEAVAS